MNLEDLDAVVVLEQLSFASPWPRSTYRRELTHSRNSRYRVVAPAVPLPGWPRLVAQGGILLLGEEMHVMTIAVLPPWRGRHIGEWLLLSLLALGREHGVETASLEVRPSNRPARALYARLGFVAVGRRRRYYPDKENALILELDRIHTAAVWSPLQRRLDDLSAQMAAGVEAPP